MNPAPVLSIQNLSLALGSSGHSLILDNISIQLMPGETCCLVGESGSGKSVTSLAVMGLLPSKILRPVGGKILLNGENLLTASDKQLRALRATTMAMIFQEPMTALNPVMKVGVQLDEVLRAHTSHGSKERRRRILEIFREVKLPDVDRIYNSYPHQISGGQRQRIMIAMALVLEPQLLIADEPTTALDVTTQKQIIALIRELRQKHNTAVLFITHDMGVVSEIADSVVVMNGGKIVEQGPVKQILSSPKEPYTRRLLQAVPSLVPREARSTEKLKAVFAAKNLSKIYRSRSGWWGTRIVAAASDVSFAVCAGRTVGIVGESGSGKSTVARCAIRLIDPNEGAIELVGKDITHLSREELKPHRRQIQMIFQDPYRSLNPRVPIGVSIAEGPTNFGTSQQEALEESKRLLELVGLPAEAATRFPHQFSGGQRQRIAIARALAMKPDVLVADEAVSALDVSVQAQVLDLLRSVQSQFGLGILFITHDLRVAAQICDDIIVMKSGRVVEYGPSAKVLVDPEADYTKQLLDAAPARGWDFANFRPIQALS